MTLNWYYTISGWLKKDISNSLDYLLKKSEFFCAVVIHPCTRCLISVQSSNDFVLHPGSHPMNCYPLYIILCSYCNYTVVEPRLIYDLIAVVPLPKNNANLEHFSHILPARITKREMRNQHIFKSFNSFLWKQYV